MKNVAFQKFLLRTMRRSNCARHIAFWTAGAIILLISLIVFFGAGEPLSAQEQKSSAKPIPKVKPHDPLGGKECSDCHRRVMPSKVNCLLAKEDLCEFCH